MKPDKIIIWLGREQFPDEKLPAIFDRLRACGVEVKFCEDIKAHKKYFYSLKEYPEDIIITFDDDIIYDNFIIEALYKSYLEHPECVCAMRVHKITFTPEGDIIPYSDWETDYRSSEGQASFNLFATGVGGVLYPPHCLKNEVFNLEALKKLSFMNDDVWLKFMEIMNRTRVVRASAARSINGYEVPDSQELALWKSNVKAGGNDMQIKAVLEAYASWRDQEGRTLLEIIREG